VIPIEIEIGLGGWVKIQHRGHQELRMVNTCRKMIIFTGHASRTVITDHRLGVKMRSVNQKGEKNKKSNLSKMEQL
jgi:hypothetical protein